MCRLLLLAVLLVALAACDNAPVATREPTYALSAPTLAPTAIFYPAVPSNPPEGRPVPGQNDLTAAAAVSGGDLPPLAVGTRVLGDPRQQVEIIAGDGTPLLADLYLPDDVTAAFPVLLLSSASAGWGDVPFRLVDRGFAVLAVTMRQNAPVGDLLAAVSSLTTLPQIDVARIAVVGAEGSADLALAACASGVPCDALALISPLTASEPAVFAYNPRPLFLAASEGDAAGVAALNAVLAIARGPVEQIVTTGSAVGPGLLASDTAATDRLLVWLESTLRGA
jgi:hypothetical protein